MKTCVMHTTRFLITTIIITIVTTPISSQDVHNPFTQNGCMNKWKIWHRFTKGKTYVTFYLLPSPCRKNSTLTGKLICLLCHIWKTVSPANVSIPLTKYFNQPLQSDTQWAKASNIFKWQFLYTAQTILNLQWCTNESNINTSVLKNYNTNRLIIRAHFTRRFRKKQSKLQTLCLWNQI